MSFAEVIFILFFILDIYVEGECLSIDNNTECDALIRFAGATGYNNWKVNHNWLNSNISYCKWYGLTCNNNNNLISMELSSNNLNGSIPESIANLSYLEVIDLHSTKNLSKPWLYQDTIFNNTICPSSILNGTLANLKYLDLGYSYVSGTIPNQINKLSDTMTYLRLDSCLFNGTIPNTITELIKLNTLKLGRQPLHGTLPFFGYKYPFLQKFAINFAALTGTIHDMFNNFPSITHLVLDGNGFHGTIPESISRLKNLEELGLNMNNLSGIIQPSFCNIWNKIMGNGSHCHIGSDTKYSGDPYYADYKWIISIIGDKYKCPLPPCCIGDAICNSSSQSYIDPCYG